MSEKEPKIENQPEKSELEKVKEEKIQAARERFDDSQLSKKERENARIFLLAQGVNSETGSEKKEGKTTEIKPLKTGAERRKLIKEIERDYVLKNRAGSSTEDLREVLKKTKEEENNRIWQETLGSAAEEITGKKIEELLPEDTARTSSESKETGEPDFIGNELVIDAEEKPFTQIDTSTGQETQIEKKPPEQQPERQQEQGTEPETSLAPEEKKPEPEAKPESSKKSSEEEKRVKEGWRKLGENEVLNPGYDISVNLETGEKWVRPLSEEAKKFEAEKEAEEQKRQEETERKQKKENPFNNALNSREIIEALNIPAGAYTEQKGVAAVSEVFKKLYPKVQQFEQRLEFLVKDYQTTIESSVKSNPEKPSESHRIFASKKVMEKLSPQERQAIDSFLDKNYQKMGVRGQMRIRADSPFHNFLDFVEKIAKQQPEKKESEKKEISPEAELETPEKPKREKRQPKTEKTISLEGSIGVANDILTKEIEDKTAEYLMKGENLKDIRKREEMKALYKSQRDFSKDKVTTEIQRSALKILVKREEELRQQTDKMKGEENGGNEALKARAEIIKKEYEKIAKAAVELASAILGKDVNEIAAGKYEESATGKQKSKEQYIRENSKEINVRYRELVQEHYNQVISPEELAEFDGGKEGNELKTGGWARLFGMGTELKRNEVAALRDAGYSMADIKKTRWSLWYSIPFAKIDFVLKKGDKSSGYSEKDLDGLINSKRIELESNVRNKVEKEIDAQLEEEKKSAISGIAREIIKETSGQEIEKSADRTASSPLPEKPKTTEKSREEKLEELKELYEEVKKIAQEKKGLRGSDLEAKTKEHKKASRNLKKMANELAGENLEQEAKKRLEGEEKRSGVLLDKEDKNIILEKRIRRKIEGMLGIKEEFTQKKPEQENKSFISEETKKFIEEKIPDYIKKGFSGPNPTPESLRAVFKDIFEIVEARKSKEITLEKEEWEKYSKAARELANQIAGEDLWRKYKRQLKEKGDELLGKDILDELEKSKGKIILKGRRKSPDVAINRDDIIFLAENYGFGIYDILKSRVSQKDSKTGMIITGEDKNGKRKTLEISVDELNEKVESFKKLNKQKIREAEERRIREIKSAIDKREEKT